MISLCLVGGLVGLVGWLVRSFVCSLVRLFVRCFASSFVGSLVRLLCGLSWALGYWHGPRWNCLEPFGGEFRCKMEPKNNSIMSVMNR